MERNLVSTNPGTMWKEISSAPNLARLHKKSSAPDLARCGKRTRQHQTWHDVERKMVSAKPGTMWKENSSAPKLARRGKKTRQHQTWHHVERKLVSTRPGTMWKGNSSAPDLARCVGKRLVAAGLMPGTTWEGHTRRARHETMKTKRILVSPNVQAPKRTRDATRITVIAQPRQTNTVPLSIRRSIDTDALFF